MPYYAGLNVSDKEMSLCILDETGCGLTGVEIRSHSEDLVRLLKHPTLPLVRIGLEAGR